MHIFSLQLPSCKMLENSHISFSIAQTSNVERLFEICSTTQWPHKERGVYLCVNDMSCVISQHIFLNASQYHARKTI
uniref:Uncharacterized protein n=1 Tax=Populus trichocarpa TaxID=3694 RepID=A0A2K2AHY7_POPTR